MPRRPLSRRRAPGAVAAVAFAVLVALLAPAAAAAKSYTIPSCDIQAHVATDGSLTVAMRQTFGFSGHFSYVYWVISKKAAASIEVLGVDGPGGPATPSTDGSARTPGTYTVSDEGDAVRVDTYFDLADTAATFTLRYRADGAAQRYTDVAQLYWQFIGQDAWTVPMGDVRVRVALPGDVPPGEVRVWGHGPLTGTVYKQPDGTVLYNVAPLPAGQMLEARIVFPAETLSRVPASTQTELPTILSEEGKWAAEANAARDAARAAEHRKAVAGWTQIVLDALALAALVWAYFRFGREHKVSLPGEYYRDIPSDLHPALVDYLWKMGDLDANAVPATIVDLTRRGVVAVEPLTEDGGFFHKDERTYQLTLDTAKWESCDEIDKELLGLLFTTVAGGPTVTIPQIKDYAKDNQKTFREQHTAWRKLVVERGKALGFMEASSGAAARTFGLVGVGLLASVVVLGWGFHAPLAFVGIPVGIAVLAGAATLKRRTREAAELHAKYKGLRNYMRDFGRMQEKPPTAVVLWEQYLVLATVFGMADEVIAAMKVKVPEVVQDPAFSTTMWWVGAHEMGAQSFAGAFSSGFASAVAASTPSSGAGGGGGFSGGGGGGGGGVGGGAG